jgi:hypothetical protein
MFKNHQSTIAECSDGILKILSRNLILLIVAQYCYVRFTNNEWEHFILQINECSGAISFDKAFSTGLHKVAWHRIAQSFSDPAISSDSDSD